MVVAEAKRRSTKTQGAMKTAAAYITTFAARFALSMDWSKQSMLDYLKREWPLLLFIIGTIIGMIIGLLYVA